jgi:hypothetical protein
MEAKIDKGRMVSFYGSTLVTDVRRTEEFNHIQYGTIKHEGVRYRVSRHAIASDWQVVGRIQ